MQATSITVSTRADIKAQTKKIAKEQGVSVSEFINTLLQQVIGKRVLAKKASEEPTPYLLQSVKTALQQKKRGKISPRFSNGKDAYKWLER